MASVADITLLRRFHSGASIAALAQDNDLPVEEVEVSIRRALGPITAPPIYGEMSQMAIIAADEAYKIGMTVDDLRAQDRRSLVAQARRRAMWRCRHELHMPSSQIGLFFRRDHTTVLYAIASEEAARNGTPAPWRLKQARLRGETVPEIAARRADVRTLRCAGCGLEGLAAEDDAEHMACMFCGGTEVTEVRDG